MTSYLFCVERGKGFEFFPHWRDAWRPYSAYLFMVTGGTEEIRSLGRRIVETAGPPDIGTSDPQKEEARRVG